MYTAFRYDHFSSPAKLAQFGWIIGPVLGAYHLRGTSRYVVMQGHRAYAVVDGTDYLACCPTLEKAMARAERAG